MKKGSVRTECSDVDKEIVLKHGGMEKKKGYGVEMKQGGESGLTVKQVNSEDTNGSKKSKDKKDKNKNGRKEKTRWLNKIILTLQNWSSSIRTQLIFLGGRLPQNISSFWHFTGILLPLPTLALMEVRWWIDNIEQWICLKLAVNVTGARKDLEEVGERRDTKTSEVLSTRYKLLLLCLSCQAQAEGEGSTHQEKCGGAFLPIS